MALDTLVLQVAAGGYGLAAIVAVTTRRWSHSRIGKLAIVFLAAALLVHSLAIALRWVRLGHGPYVDLFEILSSNVWSLHFAFLIGCLLVPRIRPVLSIALPLMLVMVAWLMSTTPQDTQAPVTYQTPWLPLHLTFGKIFLGCTVIAVALSCVVLVRRWNPPAFKSLPVTASLDELAYRFLLVAFVFESLMLIAGAIWAQDAWGRYWAWDPLETWSFVTWLALAAYLHLRSMPRNNETLAALAVVSVFVLAFSTFLGMPFITTAPHKGAI